LAWWEIGVRLLLAVVVGCIIGVEREKKNRPAGMRTHVLVCLGAALIAVVESLNVEKTIALNLAHSASGISVSMVSSFDSSVSSMLGDFAGQTVFINGEIVNPASHLSLPNPVATLGGAIIAVGVIMMVGGTALAVVLKKRSK